MTSKLFLFQYIILINRIIFTALAMVCGRSSQTIFVCVERAWLRLNFLPIWFPVSGYRFVHCRPFVFFRLKRWFIILSKSAGGVIGFSVRWVIYYWSIISHCIGIPVFRSSACILNKNNNSISFKEGICRLQYSMVFFFYRLMFCLTTIDNTYSLSHRRRPLCTRLWWVLSSLFPAAIQNGKLIFFCFN